MEKFEIESLYWDMPLTSKEISRDLKMCRTTFDGLVNKGIIPYIPWGKQRRYTRRSVIKAISENIKYHKTGEAEESPSSLF